MENIDDTQHVAMKKLRVEGIVNESSDTKSYILSSLDGEISYRAGQFLTLVALSPSGRTIRRSYSISSCPELNEPLTITVKRISNGEFSRLLFDRTRVGDTLETIGASGFFILPETIDPSGQVVFFAAGSGITPVFSLLKSLLYINNSVRALLIYSNRSSSDTIFFKQLEELQKKFHARFTIRFLFSNAADLSVSRLTPVSLEMLLDIYKISRTEATFYVCGPGDYMRMVYYTLTSLGVPMAKIKREIFYIQQPAVVPAPADTHPHQTTLISGGNVFHFTVQYPVTILQAAKLLNIHLPFSCELGQCGACVAKCLHGQVWMTRNEVLLEEEIKAGYVLTCTGYPVYGDVTLTIDKNES